MAIIKPGFTPGFRGRKQAPAWSRRAHYLIAEHDRESTRLLGPDGRDLTAPQAIEVMGGPSASYHEVIVAPSSQECAAIRARNLEDPKRATAEVGERVAKAYAQGRPHVLAIHEQDGRFHFHLAVAGTMPERALGKNGRVQKAWSQELFGDEPRIQDWSAHQRFQEKRVDLKQVIREQKENELERRQALKRAGPGRKAKAARPFEKKARSLIDRRYSIELAAIQARYEARGALGSPRYQAEVEQAGHRRVGALKRLEKREAGRALGVVKDQVGRAVDASGRGVQKGTRAVAVVSRAALNGVLKALGIPTPLRRLAQATLVVVEGALLTALRTAQEAAKAGARSSVHLVHASVKVAIGLAAAFPTGGVSLKAAAKEAGRDLGQAGEELARGAANGGVAAGRGASKTLTSGLQQALPIEVQIAVRTSGSAVKDVVTLSPLALGQTLAGGALEAGRSVANTAGIKTYLPEPLRRAFQIAGWIPMVGTAAKAAEVAAETAQTVVSAAGRGMEVDR